MVCDDELEDAINSGRGLAGPGFGGGFDVCAGWGEDNGLLIFVETGYGGIELVLSLRRSGRGGVGDK